MLSDDYWGRDGTGDVDGGRDGEAFTSRNIWYQSGPEAEVGWYQSGPKAVEKYYFVNYKYVSKRTACKPAFLAPRTSVCDIDTSSVEVSSDHPNLALILRASKYHL